MRLLAISEEVTKKGMLGFLDFVDRNREIRDVFSIVIVKGNSAGDILQVNNMYKKIASLKLFTQLTTMQKDWGGAPDIKLNDYVRIYNSQGQTPVLAAVKLAGDPKKRGNVENMKSEQPESQVIVDSLAVLKTGKLVGYASLYEIRDMLFVQNKIKSTVITSIFGKGKFGYRITASKTEVSAKDLNGVPNFHIKIETEGTLEGTDIYHNFKDIFAFEGLEDSINKKMEKEIKEFINKTKEEFNADIFGLGELLRDQDYKHFKQYKDNWDDGYAKAQIHINFNSEIKRSGLRKDPAIMK
jgi:spore germination protein KC